MATQNPEKSHVTPLQEANDPATDPERLRELTQHEEAVQRAAWRNPSLPEDIWRHGLLHRWPETWDNPMAPFYVLTWTPQENDPSSLEQSARFATWCLWKDPKRCSSEGKALLNAKVQEWWVTSESAEEMVTYLGKWSETKGNGSSEHRETLRILILCARTVDLNPKDQKILDLLQAWSDDGEDLPKASLSYSSIINSVFQFARNPSFTPWDAIYEIMIFIRNGAEDADWDEAEGEHQRHLADLIRQAMPVPPVVE